MDDICKQRISSQLLGAHTYKNPEDVVRHLLCMQSQDLKQAKRAIASRCGCDMQEVEDSFNTGKIVRTWTQRGTIHAVCAEDAGWIVKLCASKTLGSFKRRRNSLGIEDTQMDDILATLPSILEHGPLSRKDIATVLSSRGFDISANKPYHIMCYAGTLGLTVQGPLLPSPFGTSVPPEGRGNGDEGKEHCFVLSSQWIKNPKILTEDEALAELCLRYFSSHGPGTIQDLQWWSGLGVGMLRKGVEMLQTLRPTGTSLIREGNLYFISGLKNKLSPPDKGDTAKPRGFETKVHFLAGFDEFLLGYKDRTATLDLEHHVLVDKARNGVFKPTIMSNGKTIGTWSVKEKAQYCEVTVYIFDGYEVSKEELEIGVKEYEKYIGKEVRILF